MTENYTPLEVGVALSLYALKESPNTRAEKLYKHFHGHCAEPEQILTTGWAIIWSELLTIMRARNTAYACIELAMPTAQVYVDHALEAYGDEAKARVVSNLGPDHDEVDDDEAT